MARSSFKQEHPQERREAEAQRIREKYPDRIPVIVERSDKVRGWGGWGAVPAGAARRGAQRSARVRVRVRVCLRQLGALGASGEGGSRV